ncbi:MAG: hypothetical protein K8T26_02435 [Lentisphaerae bacterium]|nr:hypothetical protein [Lentisphaerota bacterium]
MNDIDAIVETVAWAGVDRNYRPSADTADLLNRALAYVHSVPYPVSLRWVCYRLLQDGMLSSKDDFESFKGLSARARKAFWNGWTPDTLADDTRRAVVRGQGDGSTEDWIRRVAEYGVRCELDCWAEQPAYVECWFEAAAMQGQFEHYLQHVTLRPFKGDASIHYKWTIATDLERLARRYPGKPIVILYFGDLDAKGLQIPKSAARDIRKWCSVEFRFVRAGLNPEHPAHYQIPANIERPGCWQWEALDDQSARQLILDCVSEFADLSLLDDVQQRQDNAERRLRAALVDIAERW